MSAVLTAFIAFLFGTIMGSFLNVVIYRLHTGKSVNGRSHCLSCGKTLSWYELIPLVSYLIQRGRCRGCSARFPARYFFVELLTGVTFLWLWSMFHEVLPLFFFHAVFLSVLIVVLVYDMRHTIIPDELVVLLSALSVLFVGLETYLTGDIRALFLSLAGAVFSALFFAALWYVSGGRWMGLGDAKLALPFGLLVGFPAAYSMIVISFFVGAVVSVGMLLLQRLLKRGTTLLRYTTVPLTIQSEVPFAPFLIVGFVLTYFFHADVFLITSLLFSQI